MKRSPFLYGWMLLLLPLLFTACEEEVTPTPLPMEEDPQNIVEIALADDQFSTLVTALQQADLVSVLEGEGPFTVFAPTNDAFAAAGIDLNTIAKEELQKVLLYHVIGGGAIKSTDIAEGQTYVTTASETGPDDNQLSLLIEKDMNVMLNSSATVSTADIEGSNGVIHVIDRVLLPLDIVGHASANSNFSSLVSALGSASGELVGVLQSEGPFTVFAPLNSAFDEIAETVATLDIDQLARVLTYHVVSGNVRSDALSNDTNIPTVNEPETFKVNIEGDSVTITDTNQNVATVVLTDVQATNGVIHVLNKVIVPGNL